jgi:cellulose synthase/poly-beta-1,6-N-acetylglucosamine synthase-like glycosyltransferase
LTSSLSKALMSRRNRRNTESSIKRTRHGAYTIDELSTVKVPVQRYPHRFRSSLAVSWTLWIIYWITRLSLIIDNDLLSWDVWATFVAETLLAAREAFLALNIVIPLLINCRPQSRPRCRLVGRLVPSVDICVTCCGEPVDIVLNTIAAATAQDYPPERFRVIVLDDGHSTALRYAVQMQNSISLDHGGPEILYRSRHVEPGTKSYFKAGNLQFGITEAKKIGDSEYFASLDADMIAEPDWLRSMLPHLILNPQIGLVNPPQVSAKFVSSMFQQLNKMSELLQCSSWRSTCTTDRPGCLLYSLRATERLDGCCKMHGVGICYPS